MGYIKCGDCGMVFDSSELKWVKESRGEFWGMPAYEDMCYCPYCNSDALVDYTPEDEEEQEEEKEE